MVTRHYVYSLSKNAWRNWRGEWVAHFSSAQDHLSKDQAMSVRDNTPVDACAVVFALLVN